MQIRNKKLTSKLNKKTGTRKRSTTGALKRAAKKRSQPSRKRIELKDRNEKLAPRGTSVEVVEVLETEIYEEPEFREFEEDEN